jgi:hypothetical protein
MEGGEWTFIDDNSKRARPDVLKHVFAYPFLLHEVLAVSALRLSSSRPALASFYRSEATRLQSHALELFNETLQGLGEQNVVAAFLFSALLGMATFFETFHDVGSTSDDTSDWAFFEKIVQSLRLLQGVLAFVHPWKPVLMTSEIGHYLSEDPPVDPEWRDEIINHFDAFRAQISQSRTLDQAQASVCDEAMRELLDVYRIAFTGNYAVWVEAKDVECETEGSGAEAKFNDQAAATILLDGRGCETEATESGRSAFE